MDPISGLIFGLWGADIAVRVWLVVALLRRGLWRNYPALVVFLSVSVPRSLLLVGAYLVGGNLGYYYKWADSQLLVLVLSCSLVVEIYVARMRRVPGFARMGAVALALFAAFSLVVAGATAGWFTFPGFEPYRWEVATRYYQTACLVTVILSTYFLRLAGPDVQPMGHPFPENTRRYVRALVVMYSGALICGIVQMPDTYTLNAIGNFVLFGTGFMAYAMWGKMRRDGQAMPPPPPIVTVEELERERRFMSAIIQDIRRRIRDAFRFAPA